MGPAQKAPTGDFAGPLGDLSAYLAARREQILAAWRGLVDRDPTLTTGNALTRADIYDHIPTMLAAFEADLARQQSAQGAQSEAGTAAGAEAHGLHRWQQGYDLREVTRELGRLNECVCSELEAYAAARAELPPGVMAEARRRWARACTVAIGESAAQYFRLQQLEAVGLIRELEAALEDLNDLERMRAELWQQAAHDLRGSVAVVANATAGLSIDRLDGKSRESFMRLLQRNVVALNHLLNDVTSLARLQAGKEDRKVAPFDAAALLRELGQSLVDVAAQRQLGLLCDGPETLLVEGDAVKMRRIAQNLVLNAIAYTQQGRIELEWGDGPNGDNKRWALTVRDTGPGLQKRPEAPLADALEQATHLAHADAGERRAQLAPPPPTHEMHAASGEGLGLSIVKRLCDLLDATIEVESAAGVGTTYRILFPRQYEH